MFFDPASIEIQQNDVGRFEGIGNAGKVFCVQGIASVAFVGIVEVDHIKSRTYFIPVAVQSQVIENDGAEIGMFEIVAKHRISLLDGLSDNGIYDAKTFARPRYSANRNRAVRRNYISISLPPFLFIVEQRRQVDRILVFYQAGFLHERFVFIVIYVVHQPVFQNPAAPYASGQQADIPGREYRRIKRSACGDGIRGCQNPVVTKKEDEAYDPGQDNMLSVDFFLFDPDSSQTGQAEQQQDV